MQGSEAELEEVEREYGQSKPNGQAPHAPSTNGSVASSDAKGVQKGVRQKSGVTGALQQIISPIFMEVCAVTFLAEWGDRSQIATIGKSQ